LKRETRERKPERKVKVTMKEQVERKKAEHVHLIGIIYIEPLALCEPIVEEIKICEQ